MVSSTGEISRRPVGSAEREPASAIRPTGEPRQVQPSSERARTRSTGRIAGLDLARAAAVLGMFGAHVGATADINWSPVTWPAIVHGRASILFALLAGVSVALLSGRTAPMAGDDLVRVRLRLFVRAAWVFAIGGVLEWLGTYVSVILGVYALLFVMAIPFLRWSPQRLLVLAGAVAAFAPALNLVLSQLIWAAEMKDAPFAWLAVTGPYPAVIWWAFVMVGLAVGRLDLRSARVRLQLFLGGAALSLLGYGAGWITTNTWADGRMSSGPIEGAERIGQWDWAWLSGAQPHSGTSFEVIGSTGVALMVVAASLVVADLFPRISSPLAAVGSMALSVYTVQLVAIWLFVEQDSTSNEIWLAFSVTAVVCAALWRRILGRGPLERLLTWSSQRAASAPGLTTAPHPL